MNSIDILIGYLGQKYETLSDSILFSKGTILEIKSIDVGRDSQSNVKYRFRCSINSDKSRGDAYLDVYEFIFGIEHYGSLKRVD